MISTGLTLATLTVVGFYMIFCKLPKKVRKFMLNRPLFTDFVGCIMTYILFGTSVTALIAAGWAGVMLSFMLAARKNPFIMGWVEYLKQKAKDLFRWVETFGVTEHETKEAANEVLNKGVPSTAS